MRYYCSGAEKSKGSPQELLPTSMPNVMLSYYRRKSPAFLETVLDFREQSSVIPSLFIDSGAFSLYQKHVEKNPGDYSYFRGDEFRDYLNQYGAFLKDAQGTPELFCSNLDVIGNPELTEWTQQYLEEHYGVKPIPVVHWPANDDEMRAAIKSLERYLEAGYEMIGLGGFFRKGIKDKKLWCDIAFKLICPESNGFLPLVKVHGYAMTSHELICRYPWFSTDSTVWGGPPNYGWVYFPRWNAEKGIWDFSLDYQRLNFSTDSPELRKEGKSLHYERQDKVLREEFERWLEHKGWDDIDFAMTEVSRYRTIVNMLYWVDLQNSRPKWPHQLFDKVETP